MIFLDAAATTPVRREVIEAMFPYLTGSFGNPSSHHDLGEQAAAALEQAKTQIAELVGCRPGEVIFTSGGTEADNLAIKGIALARRQLDKTRNRILISAIEHPAVMESAEFLARVHGFEVDVIPVHRSGLIDSAIFAEKLGPDVALASVMYANNEIGSIQPLAELAELTTAHRVPLHTDAVQASGWLSLNIAELGVDALSLSGHKFGAPKGVGALILRSRTLAEPLIHGGGQQSGLRSGTENVAFAVALACAIQLAEAERAEAFSRVSGLRDDFIAAVQSRLPQALLTGPSGEARLPSIASFCFPGTHGESVLLELERRSIICSSGSACAAGSAEPSPVLLALGISAELAQTAVRFSLPSSVTRLELDQTVEALVQAVTKLAKLGGEAR
ncbi:cysteine desulfurase family protein [Psychromicrobium lacuslunae]|uniref:cysteine desulfurase n=1 Tax=Psychromicrobium lacuslunae TaxID=1618207 RepID=A0A0D4BYU8_9MICC|nr:cysteine desulfurase family protein [Psychromicrobium lacuslunae]AJT41286.1 cysteine desulfurase [Psychromicrobium lacuslunae]